MTPYWRQVAERVATTAGYTGVAAMLGDLFGAVNASLTDVGGAGVAGGLLALLGSLLGRKVGDPETPSLDPSPPKHMRAE